MLEKISKLPFAIKYAIIGFAVSRTRVASASHLLPVRSTLVAPVDPLPILRRSVLANCFASRYPNGIAHMRYTIIGIKTGISFLITKPPPKYPRLKNRNVPMKSIQNPGFIFTSFRVFLSLLCRRKFQRYQASRRRAQATNS